MVDHEGFNGLTVIVGVTNIIRQEQQQGSAPDVTVDALVERDLAAAPGVLPPENLPLVRHRRGRLRQCAMPDMLGVTSIVRALNLDPPCSLLQYPHRLLPPAPP